MQTKLPEEFERIQQQLDEHLSTINENTFEVQALFDYLRELDAKMEKISQRLDALQLAQPQFPDLVALTQAEQQVFLALYTEETPLCFQEIAVKAKVPFSLVQEILSRLTEKGIPLLRSYYGAKLFLKLDPRFKELQAKEGIVHLSLQSFV